MKQVTALFALGGRSGYDGRWVDTLNRIVDRSTKLSTRGFSHPADASMGVLLALNIGIHYLPSDDDDKLLELAEFIS